MNNMTVSVVKQENFIDKNKRVAIIYNITDIGEYIVQIFHNEISYFIKKGANQNTRYQNLADAKDAARNENSEECYLAVNRTYQEIESSSSEHSNKRFDYMPIHL